MLLVRERAIFKRQFQGRLIQRIFNSNCKEIVKSLERYSKSIEYIVKYKYIIVVQRKRRNFYIDVVNSVNTKSYLLIWAF